MAKFRTKPVMIEARQVTKDNWRELEVWGKASCVQFIGNRTGPGDDDLDCLGLSIEALEGKGTFACIGDWIIKGTSGHFYACGAGVFKKTYEAVE